MALLILAVRASLRFVPEELIAEHEAAIAAGSSYFHRDLHRAIDEAGALLTRHQALVVVVWEAGLGAALVDVPTIPPAPMGIEVPSGTTYNTAGEVTVTLGNTPVMVYGAALAPGFAAVYQIAVGIPDSLADGDYPVIATISGAESPSNVLLTVLK